MPLDGLTGQVRAARILGGMLRTGRIVPAYLFAGPKGVGKSTAAFSFVKAMNCEDAESKKQGDFCGVCRSCRHTDSLVHPDLRLITPEDTAKDKADRTRETSRVIQIEQIREACEFLSTSAMQWRAKAVIIDNAHAMNPNAGNAFLKTLEEPPLGSVIVLITHMEETVLDTIRSRCVRVPFVPLTVESLRAIAGKKGVSVSDEQINLSNGSATSMLNESLVKVRNRALEIFTAMTSGARAEQWKDRQEMSLWFEAALTFLRDMTLLKLGHTALLNKDRKTEFAALCKSADIGVIMDCYETFFNLSRYFRLNINKGIVFNYTASKLRAVFGRG